MKKLIKLLICMCLMMAQLAVPAFAAESASGQWGELTWKFDAQTNTLTISGEGEIVGVESAKDYPWYSIKEEIHHVVIDDKVTSLPDYVFFGYGNLREIRLGVGLKTIGEDAFADCDGLKTVELPDSLEIIMEGAFARCTSLCKVRFPSNLRVIPEWAFVACESLNDLQLPEGLEKIENYAFRGCASLTELRLPKNVKELGMEAFAACGKMESIFIPKNMTLIAYGAFDECSLLSSVCYEGTEDGWNAIEIHDNNRGLIFSKIYFEEDGIERPVGSPIVTYKPVLQPAEDGCGEFTLQVIPSSVREPDSVPYLTHNENKQSYSTYCTNPVRSALAYENGRYLRVEASGSEIAIEWYDDNFTLQEQKILPLELPIYGGVYIGENYNFVVCGQGNPEERDDCEVIRVIRYSKNWERQAAASVYGEDTYNPFDSASVRFACSGDVLYIHTGRTGYTANDGLNHQSNLLLLVGISDMRMLQVLHSGSVESYGFVSHSFNQFILADGEDIVTADHGDGAPRGIRLSKYSGTAGADKVTAFVDLYTYTNNISTVDVFYIAENTGHYNYTGVEIGAFETSDSHYLIAGSSCPQTGGINQRDAQQNIFVTSVDKEVFSQKAVKTTYLTSYTDENRMNVSAPHLVKVDDDRFCLLWTVSDILYYCMLDGTGQLTTEVFYAEGKLSDCKPIVVGDCIEWYVTYIEFEEDHYEPQGYVDFYRIPLTAEAGHNVLISPAQTPTCTKAGITEGAVCGDCGAVITEAKTLLPLGHSFVDGVCTLCGMYEGMENPFTDVSEADWFYAPVLWAVNSGVTSGKSSTLFGSYDSCTRAQVVTFLWAANGKPEPKSMTNPFDDVSEDAWYLKPVLWAMENGITGGTSPTTFSPDAPCTRAQVVTFLYAAAGKPTVRGSSGFVDVADTDWFAVPVLWAAENDVTGGIGGGMFGPEQTCTRGQVVTFLYKVHQN